MEVNANSHDLHVQSDTINIIVEFAQPEYDGVKENGEKTNSHHDGAVHVFQISPTLFHPAVSSQSSSTSEINCTESAAVDTQEISRTTVVEQRKEYVVRRNASKPSNLNVPVSSVSPNPTILYPRTRSMACLQQPSINLHIENGKVTCTQLVHNEAEREGVQNTPLARPAETSASQIEGKPISSATKLALKNFLKKKSAENAGNSKSRETSNETTVPELPSILPVGEAENPSKKVTTSSIHERIRARSLSNLSPGPAREEISAAVSISPLGEGVNPSKKVRKSSKQGCVSERSLSDVSTGSAREENTATISISQRGEAENPLKKVIASSLRERIRERSLSNISPGSAREETSATVSISQCREGENARTCPDYGNTEEEILLDVATGTESEKSSCSVSVPESSSSNPVQSSEDLNETSTAVQSDKSSSLSTQHADVAMPDSECNQETRQGSKDISMSTKEVSSDTARVSTSTDVSKEPAIPVTQEVDVVVLPSLLESDITEQTKETSQESTQKQSGTKKKKTTKFHECVECGKVLSASVYRDHMNIHYDIRPHKCSECGKSFRQRTHLDKHKLLHTGEKPYVCQYCGQGFRCRYVHRDHERIHTGEKPCKCNLCGMMFRTLNQVSDHQRSIHKVRPPRSRKSTSCRKTSYKCGICNKTFSWSSALSMHKKTHSDVYPYKCSKCPKVFKQHSNLWNHKRSHSKEKPFECDICGQRLKRRGNLKRHILTQHDPEEAEYCLKTSKEFEFYRTMKAKKANNISAV